MNRQGDNFMQPNNCGDSANVVAISISDRRGSKKKNVDYAELKAVVL